MPDVQAKSLQIVIAQSAWRSPIEPQHSGVRPTGDGLGGVAICSRLGGSRGRWRIRGVEAAHGYLAMSAWGTTASNAARVCPPTYRARVDRRQASRLPDSHPSFGPESEVRSYPSVARGHQASEPRTADQRRRDSRAGSCVSLIRAECRCWRGLPHLFCPWAACSCRAHAYSSTQLSLGHAVMHASLHYRSNGSLAGGRSYLGSLCPLPKGCMHHCSTARRRYGLDAASRDTLHACP